MEVMGPGLGMGHCLRFAHPQATRCIALGGAEVAYVFKRSKRRTIGMSIGLDGLVVSAPRWVSVSEVEAALYEKADWISRKLVEMQQRQQQLGATRMVWADGVALPYLGQPLHVIVDAAAHALQKNSTRWEPAVSSCPSILRLGLLPDAEPSHMRDAVQAWLMGQARALFIERLNHYAPPLGVQWTRLSLSSATTRWGSASANGAIRLNWRLIHYKLDVIDYVVVHELSHLRVMNHSPRFWETVHSVMPDYAQRRRVLKDEPLPAWA